jgi:hypothetical protein
MLDAGVGLPEQLVHLVYFHSHLATAHELNNRHRLVPRRPVGPTSLPSIQAQQADLRLGGFTQNGYTRFHLSVTRPLLELRPPGQHGTNDDPQQRGKHCTSN